MSYIIDIERCESPQIEIEINSCFKCSECCISTLYGINCNNITKPYCLNCFPPTNIDKNQNIYLLICRDGETFEYATYSEKQFALEKYYNNKYT